MPTPPQLSVVVPVFNEEANLDPLTQEIVRAMDALGRPWELLYVDDGSTDRSLDVLRRLAALHPPVRYLSFAENRGQSAAFCAGFDEAAAPVVVTLDADLQNDPADIPALLALFESGHDMAIGIRARRKDTAAKRWASKVANAIRRAVVDDGVTDTGCSLKVMRTDLLRRLPRFKNMHRYLAALMRMHGASIAEAPVNHRPRHAGASKYGNFERAVAGVRDLIGVRWLMARSTAYRIKERGGDGRA